MYYYFVIRTININIIITIYNNHIIIRIYKRRAVLATPPPGERHFVDTQTRNPNKRF